MKLRIVAGPAPVKGRPNYADVLFLYQRSVTLSSKLS
jgi:hypothetical protein